MHRWDGTFQKCVFRSFWLSFHVCQLARGDVASIEDRRATQQVEERPTSMDTGPELLHKWEIHFNCLWFTKNFVFVIAL